MDLVSEEHELLQLALNTNKGVVAQDRVVKQKHEWKQALPGERKIFVLSVNKYNQWRQRCADQEEWWQWNSMYLCNHHKYDSDLCVYCQASVLNPDVELREIETAILEASGTYKERQAIVIQQLCCGAIKPAKREH